MTTTFSDKTNILADLWLNFRAEDEFKDFIEYNDLGLPLAYMISFGIVEEVNETAKKMVEETFDLLLAGLSAEDTGFETLDDILGLDEE